MRWPALSLTSLLLILPHSGLALAEEDAGKAAEGKVSQTEMESRVKADLAERLDAAPEEIRVVKTEERLWLDQTLGCVARRGMVEPKPEPIEGYRIELAVGERRLVYHTDRQGRFVRGPAAPRDVL